MALGAAALAFLLLAFFAFGAEAADAPGVAGVRTAADQVAIACPTPGEPCKVLVLTPNEEQLLIRQNGVLDTASSGRYIDLGNVVAYFRMKLMQAPQGAVQPLPKPVEAPLPNKDEPTAKIDPKVVEGQKHE